MKPKPKYRMLTKPFTIKKGDEWKHDGRWWQFIHSIGLKRDITWLHEHSYRRPIQPKAKK